MKGRRGEVITVILAIIGILVIVGGVAAAIAVAISSSDATPTPTPTPTPAPTPGGSFTYNGILLGIKEWDDYDGDGISDRIEYWQWHTDPTSIYTNNNPIDDFNAIYTYGLDPLNSTEIAEFISRIPNVEAKRWAVVGQNEQTVGGVTLWDKNVTEIGMRDPVVQYYARQASIHWEDSGHNIGALNLHGQPMFLNYSFDANDSVSVSYYFTHGRKGICGTSAYAHAAVLSLMGYKSYVIAGCVEDGEGHGWVEVVINETNYVANYDLIEKADSFYQDNKWTINVSSSVD